MNKKYLIAGGVIVVLIIIFVFIVISQQKTSTQAVPQQSQSQNSPVINYRNSQKTPTEISPSLAVTPSLSSPSNVVQSFYNYYLSSHTNPLANGAFQNSPYLAPAFKGLISSSYNNGNIPVFCPQNRQTKVVVGKEVQVNDNSAILMEETISQAPPGTKDLYTVTVQEINNQWYIFDINCL